MKILNHEKSLRQETSRGPPCTLSVPAGIAKVLPVGQEYEIELTDDGILYRPVESTPPVLPAWVKR